MVAFGLKRVGLIVPYGVKLAKFEDGTVDREAGVRLLPRRERERERG